MGESFTTSVRIVIDGLQQGDAAHSIMWTWDPGGVEKYSDHSPYWTDADAPVDYETTWTVTADSPGTWTSCVTLVLEHATSDGVERDEITRCSTFEVSEQGGGGGGGGTAKRPTRITIRVNPDKVSPGEQFSVSGGLFDDSQSDWWNHPIAGARIRVVFKGQTKTATTSASGEWSVVFTAPAQEGTYGVRASFAGDSQYDGTSASGTVRVQRQSKKNCTIELIFPRRVRVGDVVNVTVVLRDAETHREIRGKVVTLYIEAESHRVESGSTFTIQAKYTGTIDVGARFEGDEEYNGAYDPGGLIEVWTRPEITITYVGCGE